MDAPVAVEVLAVVVGVLAVLQGWQVYQSRRNRNNNPTHQKLDDISKKLDIVSGQLGKMEQRLSDIWDRVKE